MALSDRNLLATECPLHDFAVLRNGRKNGDMVFPLLTFFGVEIIRTRRVSRIWQSAVGQIIGLGTCLDGMDVLFPQEMSQFTDFGPLNRH